MIDGINKKLLFGVLIIIVLLTIVAGLKMLKTPTKPAPTIRHLATLLTQSPSPTFLAQSPTVNEVPGKKPVYSWIFYEQKFLSRQDEEGKIIYPCARNLEEAQRLLSEISETEKIVFWVKRGNLYYIAFASRDEGWPWHIFSCDVLRNIRQGSLFNKGRQKIADLAYLPQISTEIYLLIDTLLYSGVIGNHFYTSVVPDKLISRSISQSEGKIEVKDKIVFNDVDTCDYDGCIPESRRESIVTYQIDPKLKEIYLIVP